MQRIKTNWRFLLASTRLAVLALLCLLCLPIQATSSKPPSVAQWERFEQTLKSSVSYANPLRDVALQAVFTSPSGEANLVLGFWDGGKVWRVRFSPNETGRWSFK